MVTTVAPPDAEEDGMEVQPSRKKAEDGGGVWDHTAPPRRGPAADAADAYTVQ